MRHIGVGGFSVEFITLAVGSASGDAIDSRLKFAKSHFSSTIFSEFQRLNEYLAGYRPLVWVGIGQVVGQQTKTLGELSAGDGMRYASFKETMRQVGLRGLLQTFHRHRHGTFYRVTVEVAVAHLYRVKFRHLTARR